MKIATTTPPKMVRILRNYEYPDLLRQTPGNKGVWGNMQFKLDDPGDSDYVLILCGLKSSSTVFCPPEHLWALMQEPPTEHNKVMHKGLPIYNKIFMQDTNLRGNQYLLSQPALPWHVNKSYDELVECGIPPKNKDLSWVISNIKSLKGHRKRIQFLAVVKSAISFDLYGRGFQYISDKWDGLASYRYSFAVENYQNPYYWSEKISDCFLSWTMPIYFGCNRIREYFPEESMIVIDDLDDSGIIEKIRDSIAANRWKKNLDAIEYARNLVLNQYQIFPFITNLINSWESTNGVEIRAKQEISIPALVIPKTNMLKRIGLGINRRIIKLNETYKKISIGPRK